MNSAQRRRFQREINDLIRDAMPGEVGEALAEAKRNALKDATYIDELEADRIERVRHFADSRRLIAWILDETRRPANTAFTAGPERQVAYHIEDLLRKTRREES